MSLEFMYITNNSHIVELADEAGVDRIWIDIETIGKEERQVNMNTVKSNHTLNDIDLVTPYIKKAKLQVRVNPINPNSFYEINTAIKKGADIIMLPMFKTITEIKEFIEIVKGRAKTVLLLETREAHEILDDILNVKGIDEIHIGLNDLHLAYNKNFMFELLLDGTVEQICKKIKKRNIPYGFGGVSKLGTGVVASEKIIAEHYRMQSTRVILSRSFFDSSKIVDSKDKYEFYSEVMKLREFEKSLASWSDEDFIKNRDDVYAIIKKHVERLKKQESVYK